MVRTRDSLATRLYRGEVSYNFIGHRRRWYAASATVMLIGLISLGIRGINPSIDFTGGAQFAGPLNGHTVTQLRNVVSSKGVDPDVVEVTGSGADKRFEVQTKTLTVDQTAAVSNALAQEVGVNVNTLDITTVGSTWGSQITHKAVLGLVIFLIAVIAYLSVRFEWKMALAAIVALLHDLVITAGIYSLSGFQVSPSTVIALLTILGYSLYDTVVVFDKVRENTASIAGGSRMTFSQAANLAVNQTLVRSINTSVIALLPVIGLLVIGAGLLGAGSLNDLSLALLIGLASGAYSSIFIATPLLCDLKERESTYQMLAKRVASRRAKEARDTAGLTPATVGVPVGATKSARTAVEVHTDDPPDAYDDDDDGEVDSDAPASPPRTGAPPRAGARPQGQRRTARGSRPGGRGGRSRKRR